VRFNTAALTLFLLLSAGDMFAQPFQRKTEATPSQPLAGETQALWSAYERAVYDSSVYQRWNVRPLRPLSGDEHGQVLVAMLTSRDGNVGETITAGPYGIWVTGVAIESFYLHTIPNGYPWTHLGYTYNWTPGADRYGASEYVIRPRAKALIVDKAPPTVYCANPAP